MAQLVTNQIPHGQLGQIGQLGTVSGNQLGTTTISGLNQAMVPMGGVQAIGGGGPMMAGPYVGGPDQLEIEMKSMDQSGMPGGLQEVVDDEVEDPAAVPWQRALLCHLIFAALAMIFAWVAVIYPTVLLNEQADMIKDSMDLLTLQSHVNDAMYYSEVLTNSARMCKQEGSDVFKTDYTAATSPLDSAVADYLELRPDLKTNFDSQTVTPKSEITKMETEALKGCDDESVDSDLGDLESDTYEEWKAKYNKGLKMVEHDLEDFVAEHKEKYQDKKDRLWNAIYVCVCLLSIFLAFLVASGALVDMCQEGWMKQAKQNKLPRGEYTPEDDSLSFWAFMNPILLFLVVCLMFVCILVPFALNHNALVMREMSDELVALRREVGLVRYHEEIMSSSARMCAKTENVRWKTRYLMSVEERDRAMSMVKVIEERLKEEYNYNINDEDFENGQKYEDDVQSAKDALTTSENTLLEVCATDSGPDSDQEELLFETAYLSEKISSRDKWDDLNSEVEKSTEDQITKNKDRITGQYRGGCGFLCALQFFNGLLFLFLVYRMVTLKYTTKVESVPR